jgi:ABC-type transporter Mla subunit MlaD
MAPRIDPLAAMKDLQERAEFLLNADKHLAEVVRLLKNTNDTLERLNAVVDRFVAVADDVEKRVGPVTGLFTRFDRLEQAALNIERATMGVEDAMLALPRALRDRITKRASAGPPEKPEA